MSKLERVILEGGEVLLAHPKSDCFHPEACVVHSPTNHHMRGFHQHWRGDRALMERICPHGVGHPDPDHMAHLRTIMTPKQVQAEGIHGCCGCCAKP